MVGGERWWLDAVGVETLRNQDNVRGAGMLKGMAEAMVAAYQERKAKANGAYARAKAGQDRYLLAVLGLVGVLVRSLWLAITRGHGYWTVAVVVLILAGMGIWLLRVRRQVTRAWRLSALYEKGLKRLSGEQAALPSELALGANPA